MNKQQLKLDIDKLHNLKMSIGNLTYGEASKAKYAMGNLIKKIEFTTNFLGSMALPVELIDSRDKAFAQINPAVQAILQEAGKNEKRSNGHELISTETDNQSEVIRRALGNFDTEASRWLESNN